LLLDKITELKAMIIVKDEQIRVHPAIVKEAIRTTAERCCKIMMDTWKSDNKWIKSELKFIADEIKKEFNL
jgi:hypothetical protein